MGDNSSLPSPSRPTSSFFSTPRLFTSKSMSETEAVTSPTSILETRPFFGLKINPFWSESNTPKTIESKTKRHWDISDTKAIGLVAIVDSLIDRHGGFETKQSSKPQTRMVIFGSQLKIQIPPLPSPKLEQAGFGIERTNSHLGQYENAVCTNGCLSVSEMELSEDYTCVISRGMNPKATHIFDNCVVECCEGVPVLLSRSWKENKPCYPSESFLSFCYYCKNYIEQGKDIYMYRGEKAFCSSECRYQEMLSDEEEE